MNVALLRRVQEQILREPERFEMDAWINYLVSDQRVCQTMMCIGGWAIALSGEKVPRTTIETVEALSRLLDVHEKQVYNLCFEANWPDAYRLTDEDGCYQYTTPELASKRIDAFIVENNLPSGGDRH